MAGEEKRGDYSFLVLMIFAITFIVFTFFNKPGSDLNSSSPVSAAVLSNINQQASSLTIGITLALIVIIGVFGFFFIKYKLRKKIVSQPVTDKGLNLSEEQIDKLFTEENKLNLSFGSKNESAIGSSPIEISGIQSKIEEQPVEQEFNEVKELKSKLLDMISKNIPPQKMLQELVKLGYKRKEIDATVEQINFDRLKSFVDKALKQGYKREIIIKALLKKRWQRQQIEKVFKQSPKKEELDLNLI